MGDKISIIKSFSVGNGDMFYIKHGTDNFSIIDCNLIGENKNIIVSELIKESKEKGIKRFISTHFDKDHINGLEYLFSKMKIANFYCVENSAKNRDIYDFEQYCELRDGETHYYIKKNFNRRWINLSGSERGSAGISILWPDQNNDEFKKELNKVEKYDDYSPNNISPIIKYSLKNGVNVLWFGDLEKDFLDKIKENLEDLNANIVFAPHHGRRSGRLPKEILDKIKPSIIVVGEAPTEDLNYYSNYNTITQNSAGDIVFDCGSQKVDIYVSNENYGVDFLDNDSSHSYDDLNYIGTLKI